MSRHDVSYDFEDFGMSAQELQAKYDTDHPQYTQAAYETFYGILRQVPPISYWEWVVSQIKDDDDEIPGNDAQGNPIDSELVPMNDLDDFVRHLTAWHDNKVKQLRHLQQIPSGNEVEIATFDGICETHVLAGDKLTGFIIGIEMALMLMGALPFVVETEDDNGG